MKVIITGIIILSLCQPCLAAMNFLYNPKTNHQVQDGTNRTKIEILKTLNKQTEEADYQMLTLTSEQEALLKEGKITVVVENGILIVKNVIPIVTEVQLAAQAFEQLILTEFPQITDVKQLTPQMVDEYLVSHPLDKDLISKFMKAFLFYAKSKER